MNYVVEDANMGPWMNAPGTANPWYNMPAVNRSPYYCPGMPPMMAGAMVYPMLYPDIYYKVQPFIVRACDEMTMMGMMMPTQEAMDKMTERVTDNVCKMYPDMAKYAQDYEAKVMVESSYDSDDFMGRRHRRGLLGDLISILLFSELFRGRRF